jgi:prepilin-type N-terminal cleavage/methylation domain-containing protein
MNYIKTNNKWAGQRGTTLIELSVVIAVILLLVGVLFIGVQAWRDGANKAASLVNMSSVQKAVRGYQNVNLLNTNDALTSDLLVGPSNYFAQLPLDPYNSNAPYNYMAVVPPSGTPYATSGKLTLTAAQTLNW